MTPPDDPVVIPEVVLDFSALDRLPTDKDLPSDDFGEPVALRNMPTGQDLPYDDGEPMESPWHRDAMILLIDSIGSHWRDRTDFFVGGNMFVYFSTERVFNKNFRGPDFFVVKGVDRNRPRVSWISWEEGGRLPDVIVELISPTTATIDRVEKKKLYGDTFRTSEYFCYDPRVDRLEGWRYEVGSGYVPIPTDAGDRMWCQRLGLFLGRWDGSYLETTGRLLRFFTPDGSLVRTDKEKGADEARSASLRASIEAQRASFEADRADSETARANAEAVRANTAEANATAEAAARLAAEERAAATAAENDRLTQELEALRKQQPPTTP